jgi:hypothetical protein
VESYIALLEAFMKAIEQPSLEQLAQRKAALERKRRQRAREKARSHQAMVDQWTTHGQKATLQAEYDRGIATGDSWREIGDSLGQIVKGWERGR